MCLSKNGMALRNEKKNLRKESWQRTSGTTKWDKLGQIGVRGTSGTRRRGDLSGTSEQGEGGLQIFVGQVGQGQGVCPLEPFHLSQMGLQGRGTFIRLHHQPHYDSVYYLSRSRLLPARRFDDSTCLSYSRLTPFCDIFCSSCFTLSWRLSRSLSRYTKNLSLIVSCCVSSLQSDCGIRMHLYFMRFPCPRLLLLTLLIPKFGFQITK